MKKTELKDVYCVPKTEEEWWLLDAIHGFNVVGEENGFIKSNDIVVYEPEGLYQACLRLEDADITEIPVSQFIDLLEDKIVDWRLEEIGFKYNHATGLEYYNLQIEKVDISWSVKYGTAITKGTEDIWLNIKTFTELETLIRFLKP